MIKMISITLWCMFCDQPFWIKWDEDGELLVGSGKLWDPSAQIMLRYSFDKDLPIKYMSVCTGWGSSGEWILFG